MENYSISLIVTIVTLLTVNVVYRLWWVKSFVKYCGDQGSAFMRIIMCAGIAIGMPALLSNHRYVIPGKLALALVFTIALSIMITNLFIRVKILPLSKKAQELFWEIGEAVKNMSCRQKFINAFAVLNGAKKDPPFDIEAAYGHMIDISCHYGNEHNTPDEFLLKVETPQEKATRILMFRDFNKRLHNLRNEGMIFEI